MLLHVQALLEKAVRIGVHHADGLGIGEFGDGLGRSDEQELGARAAVHQQRRQHQRRTIGSDQPPSSDPGGILVGHRSRACS
ncbi:hypothetical protein [Roseomonas sp. HF4]|uniref:hypothetical protein n=1 Tax=Roseomonas sp. HF4 TaxID=2562313 RepID=UPI0010C0EA12|nr:hypothetical protein [Roseomonas sp. HF4]